MWGCGRGPSRLPVCIVLYCLYVEPYPRDILCGAADEVLVDSLCVLYCIVFMLNPSSEVFCAGPRTRF